MNRKPPSIGYDERMTPTHAALLPVLTNSLNMLREALDGLPDEATAWTPAPNTNSLTVLTMHSLTSLRFFLGNGSGRVTEISRYRAEDRAEAFASKPESAASLIAHIDAAVPGYRAILEGGTEADLPDYAADVRRRYVRHQLRDLPLLPGGLHRLLARRVR